MCPKEATGLKTNDKQWVKLHKKLKKLLRAARRNKEEPYRNNLTEA